MTEPRLDPSPSPYPFRSPAILVIEDEPGVRSLLVDYLKNLGYRSRAAADGVEGLASVRAEMPDLILCDCMMPNMDGMAVLEQLKADPKTRLVPIVMLTGNADLKTKVRALARGVDGFLTKPPEPVEMEVLLKNLLRTKAFTDELVNAETVLFSLAEGVEAKDPYTGSHCKRLSAHSVMLGEALKASAEDLVVLRRAGVLHDLGKIGIPDRILLKPGPLTPEEWVIMKEHPAKGERICKPMRSMGPVLPIIRHHHEHWNGNGYPDGLKGEAIPFTARVFQVLDAHDALRTRRPYKPPFSKEETFRILEKETGEGKWDPRVMEAFLKMMSGPVPHEETYQEDFAKATRGGGGS